MDLLGEYNVNTKLNAVNLSLFDVHVEDSRMNAFEENRNDGGLSIQNHIVHLKVPIGSITQSKGKKIQAMFNEFCTKFIKRTTDEWRVCSKPNQDCWASFQSHFKELKMGESH